MTDSQTADDAEPFRASLDLSNAFAGQIRTGGADVLSRLVPEMAPYHATLRLTGNRLDVTGDEAAVMMLQEVVQTAAEASQDGASPEQVWAADAIAASLRQALERGLAFRVPGLRNAVRPKTVMQHAFMSALLAKSPPVIIGAGPTGTGKTHLALAAGLNLLEDGKYRHLVIARPHVFEPGDVVTAQTRADTAYDGQFAAIEDELIDLVGPEELTRLREARRLEIMPVGRMRGRTFQNAYVIVDEAQNMNVQKTRMAVTRLGQNSRIVLTGDPSHVELKDEGPSGLAHLMGLVEGQAIARVFRFAASQIVRDPAVATLEALYAQDNPSAPA
ncbi:PhoH family protein [Maricaulis sp.]|uniref:PhoH family protein n=1 Tax=Maricaulis sp. TaxID=1486257 RepID=UPI002B26C71A|nr:PhoH family protein [Maricaulis sp.]